MAHLVVSSLQPFHGLLLNVRILITKNRKKKKMCVTAGNLWVNTVVDAKAGVDDKIMLDTNIMSEAMRDPRGTITKRIQSIDGSLMCCSIVVAAELRLVRNSMVESNG